MKLVINKCYGGFSLSEVAASALGLDGPYAEIARCDQRLITLVEADAAAAAGSHAKLRVVEIPDEVTDWEINDYDGVESVVYVVNGRLHHI